MKTQLRKPARTKARYTEEYKQEALELWRASGRSAAKVAAELGIRPPLLYRWAHPFSLSEIYRLISREIDSSFVKPRRETIFYSGLRALTQFPKHL